MLFKLMRAKLRYFQTLGTFKVKWLTNHANGQDTHLFSNLGNDGRSAGSSTAAHPSRDKDHMSPLQYIGNAGTRLFSRCRTNFWLSSRP